MSFQDETNSLVFLTSGVVARSLQIAADMRLARASPEVQNPARLSLILKAHWNKPRDMVAASLMTEGTLKLSISFPPGPTHARSGA